MALLLHKLLKKDACEEMHVETVLKDKRLRSTKTQFAYEAPDEPVRDALKRLETTFFNEIINSAIASLDDWFETLGQVKNKFRVLQNFQPWIMKYWRNNMRSLRTH
ncbi:hypothetical protein LDENG_00232370 [Lucifuga dentata]|nr:hypothetical protein LDENG_00232370 [Lucifuga dentata]